MKKLILILTIVTLFLPASLVQAFPSFDISFETHIPENLPKNKKVPLFVMIHGCKQTATDIAALSRIKELANKKKFIVLLPEQSSFNNPMRCWNWFLDKNQKRDGHEIKSIVEEIYSMAKDAPIDLEQVFVAGLSSGGATAGMLGAYYPELFKAVAIHSGASFKRATFGNAVKLLEEGPANYPDIVDNCCNKKVLPPLYIIHGTDDGIVHPSNVDAIITDLAPASRSELKVEMIKGLGHAWSGGDPDEKFSSPEGPNSTLKIWNFFKKHKNVSRQRKKCLSGLTKSEVISNI